MAALDGCCFTTAAQAPVLPTKAAVSSVAVRPFDSMSEHIFTKAQIVDRFLLPTTSLRLASTRLRPRIL
jgi:hypothetical protein